MMKVLLNHVCPGVCIQGVASSDALALVTTAGNDPLTSAEPAPLTLVRTDRRPAAKRLLLVP
jgi:hypothetical protein